MAATQTVPPGDVPEELTARHPFAFRAVWQPTFDDQGGRYRGRYLREVGGDPGGGHND
jgi:hypothetical protein